MGPRAPYPAVQVLRGLPAPTPREYRELRAPDPLGSDPVGVAHPHTPGVSGATRPRTPRFTFGRPKVNRKTAKTKVLDSFFQSVCVNGETSLPLNQVLVI